MTESQIEKANVEADRRQARYRAEDEIKYRLERETRYVLLLGSSSPSATEEAKESRAFLIAKLADNNKTIALLGQFLEQEYGDKWETFYRLNYWEKK